MLEIRKLRRENLDKPAQQRLRHEDEREERELQSYVAHAIAQDMLNAMPGSRPTRTEDQKTAAEQQQAMQYENTTHPANQRLDRHGER